MGGSVLSVVKQSCPQLQRPLDALDGELVLVALVDVRIAVSRSVALSGIDLVAPEIDAVNKFDVPSDKKTEVAIAVTIVV